MLPESSTTPAYCSVPHLESELAEVVAVAVEAAQAAVVAEVPTAAPYEVGQR